MVIALNAPAAGLAGLGALQQIAIAQLKATLAATIQGLPQTTKAAWVGANGSAAGNGSLWKPWLTLEQAAAGIPALGAAAVVADAVPTIIRVTRGNYSVPTTPFKAPVILVLEEGATIDGTAPIPVSLVARTSTTALAVMFGIVSMSQGPTAAPGFAITMGTGASAYLPVQRYQGQPGQLPQFTLRGVPASVGYVAPVNVVDALVTGAIVATGTNATFEGCNINAAVTAGGAITARQCITGPAGTLNGGVVTVSGSTLTGDVTGATVTLDDESADALVRGTITVTGTVIYTSRAAVAVQGDTIAAAGSPQVVTFPTAYQAAPSSVVVTPSAGDATTFAVVSAITATGFTITYGGTNPVSFRWVSVE